MVTESPPLPESLPLMAAGLPPNVTFHHHHYSPHGLLAGTPAALQAEHHLADRVAHMAPHHQLQPLQLTGRREAREREDPMSHRIIEKRRRDRMNNCLADLSRLIPSDYLKKGRGRIEKTEIIEMAIKHMQYLQSRANLASGIDVTVAALPGELRVAKCEQSPVSERCETSLPELTTTPPPMDVDMRPVCRPIITEHYRLGYEECMSEVTNFLVELEGYSCEKNSLCFKLTTHLQKHCDKIMKGDRLNHPRSRQPGEATSSSGSSSSCGPTGSGGAANGSEAANEALAAKANGAALSCSGSSPEEAPRHPFLPGSQLRDILCTSPSSPPSPHHQYHPGHGHYESCPGGDADGPDAHHPYPDPSHHHNYKFKNTIKQRFSEEHNSNKSGSNNNNHISNNNNHNINNSALLKRRRTAARSPLPPPESPSTTPTPSASHPASQPCSQASVPIFVLHAKGSFYIPLTVSCEALAPFMDVDLLSDSGSSSRSSTLFGGASSLGPVPPVVLHPVTISVNFQQFFKPPHTPTLHAPQPALPPPAPVPPPPSAHSLAPAPQATPVPPHPWARLDTAGTFIPMSPWEIPARQ